ncbi:MAG: reverse transcriptase family protein [Lachnospiraceae bacterium]|nr:reverse transcriptase family protein [Lachnospiraceae bacterium]
MKMSKCYQIESSPLYRLRNRRKLAELLNLPKNFFKESHTYCYNEFSKPKPNGDGERHFTVPPEDLKDIQKHICKLLNRITTLEWVMSGKKSCSYITNAEVHLEHRFVKTMDISKFYDSAQRSRIYQMFSQTFKMAPDIAWIMTELVTYNGTLPTGSPSSQLIIYWTYCDMFQRIKELSEEYNCCFSLYVDDMTFSSDFPIKIILRNEVSDVLRKNGLLAKSKKDHYYQANDFKVVTGVGIKQGKKVVPNCKRKQIIELYVKCKKGGNIYEIEKLNGTLCSLRQIEPDIFPEIYGYVHGYEQELKKLSRNRFYKAKRKKGLYHSKQVHKVDIETKY